MVPGDANLEFFIVVGEPVLERGAMCLVYGEGEDCKVLV